MKNRLLRILLVAFLFPARMLAQLPSDINGLKLWLDASDVNATGTNPATGTSVATWVDKSGNNNNAFQLSGQSAASLVENVINGKPVLRFTRQTLYVGSVYSIPGIDMRAMTMPTVTIFTVYRQGARTGDQAIWGNDAGFWDRFFGSSWGRDGNLDNGVASLGPTNPAAVVRGAGIQGVSRLLTAVYDHQVANGSSIYFNGQVVTNFTDQTYLNKSLPNIYLGWDGNDNCFNGDVAEMIIYNRKLTPCEMVQVNRYLVNKYDVPLTTVTINANGPTTIDQGKTVTLSASANGTNGSTSFQWLRNGKLIDGATSASINAAAPGDYRVVLKNICADTSNALTIRVNATGMVPPGNTLLFDGTDDYVNCGKILSPSYTKEAWIYTSGGTSGNNIISGASATGNTSHAFWAPASNGFKLSAGHNGNWSYVQDATALELNKWYHVAVTYDVTSRVMSLYKNGVRVAQASNVPAFTDDSTVLIGAFSNSATFRGGIDEVRLYNKALSQVEIQADMFKTVSTPPSTLIAYYNFDQAVAGGNNTAYTMLADQSDAGNYGQLVNFTLNGNSSNWVESMAMVVPQINAANNITTTGFTANWAAPQVGAADSYLLDIATTPDFSSFVTGYNARQVSGSVTSLAVTGLRPARKYYYRVRAVNNGASGEGYYSDTVSVTTAFQAPNHLLGSIGGLKLWLDGSDVLASGTNPAANSSVSTWYDKSGYANNAVTFAGKNSGTLLTGQIGGQSVIHFTRQSSTQGSVYDVPDVDIRAASMTATTIFTVYRQGVQSGDQALWGDDDGGWDRFYFSSWPSYYLAGANNGGASLGPTNPAAVIPGAGVPGKTRLLTAVYSNGVNNGSAIYFDGKVVTRFTDNTHPTNAQTSFRIGFDGDDNCYNGDIAEVIVFDRKLTDCELLLVNKYLGGKYGVQFSSIDVSPSGTTSVAKGKTITLTSNVSGVSYQWLRNGNSVNSANDISYTTSLPGNYQAAVNYGSCLDTSLATQVTILPSLTVAPGNALAFDGVNDYVNCGNGLTASYTKEAWIYLSAPGNDNPVLSGNSASGDSHAFGIPFSGSTYRLSAGHNGNWTQVQDNNALQLKRWYHVAVTYDEGSTTMRLYKDGVMVAENANVPAFTGSSVMLIGGMNINGTYKVFGGNIDEVRVYDNALSAAAIQADMYQKNAASQGLLAYYDFDEGTAAAANTDVTVLVDMSGSERNASLQQFALSGNASNWVESYAMVNIETLQPTHVLSDGFTANWSAPSIGTADRYFLDVSLAPDFASFVSGYQALAVTGNSYAVTGLNANTAYYYRLRPDKLSVSMQGSYSKTVIAATDFSPPGNALAFDGVDDYVTFSDSLAFMTPEATVGLWLRPEWAAGAQTAPGYHVFTAIRGPLAASSRYELSVADDYSKLYLFNGTARASVNYPFRKGSWYHVAVSFTATGAIAYVNGEAIGNFGITCQPTDNGSVLLGTNLDNVASCWNGAIDELRFYNKVLTAADIKTDMLSRLPVTVTGLVAHYNFSANLVDQTTNGHNGTAYNFAFTGDKSNWVESYAMVIPVPVAASNIEANDFIANWNAPAIGAATGYLLDVSDDPAFTSFVSGYNALPVTGFSQLVKGLRPFRTYYYRVRADKSSVAGQGAFSAAASLTTIAPPVVLTRTAFIVCRGNQTAALDASFAGGSLSFNIKWYKNGQPWTASINNYTATDTTKSTASALGAGKYRVEVTDVSNTVIAVAEYELIDPPQLTISTSVTPVSCFNKCDGKVVLSATGGVTPYLFVFGSNAPTGGTNYNNVCAGTYAANVTDNNGCVVNAAPVVIANPPATGINLYRDTLICKNTTLNISAAIAAPATYNWSGDNGFNASTAAVSISAPGLYKVTVNQTGSCTYIDSIRMRYTANEAVPARMVLTASAFVNESVVAVNLTNQPQSQAWTIPSGAQVISQSDEKLVMKFPVRGQYEVKLAAKSNDVCITRDSAKVLVQPATTDIGNVREITVREVNAAPNPTTGLFKLVVKMNQSGKVSVRIYSITGLLAYAKVIPENGTNTIIEQVDLSGQNKGTYIIVVETANSSEVRKIILN